MVLSRRSRGKVQLLYSFSNLIKVVGSLKNAEPTDYYLKEWYLECSNADWDSKEVFKKPRPLGSQTEAKNGMVSRISHFEGSFRIRNIKRDSQLDLSVAEVGLASWRHAD
jgi:hypothetical protein